MVAAFDPANGLLLSLLRWRWHDLLANWFLLVAFLILLKVWCCLKRFLFPYRKNIGFALTRQHLYSLKISRPRCHKIQTQSWRAWTRFPVLVITSATLLRALFGSVYGLCPLLLARLVTLVLVWCVSCATLSQLKTGTPKKNWRRRKRRRKKRGSASDHIKCAILDYSTWAQQDM